MGRAANIARLHKNNQKREAEAKAKELKNHNTVNKAQVVENKKELLKKESGESKTVASERKEDMNLDKGVYADIKAPEVKTKYLSDKTKKELDSMNSNRVNSTINTAKAAPGVVYGVADIAAGEKVSGVIAIAKSAPALVKGKVQDVKAKANFAKSAKSLSDDMKGLDGKEKMEALKEYGQYTASSGIETIKGKPEEIKNDVKKTVDAVKDMTNKDKHDERVKTAEKRLNIEDLNAKQNAKQSGMEY